MDADAEAVPPPAPLDDGRYRSMAAMLVEHAMGELTSKNETTRERATSWWRTRKAAFWVTAAGLDYEAVVDRLEAMNVLPEREE